VKTVLDISPQQDSADTAANDTTSAFTASNLDRADAAADTPQRGADVATSSAEEENKEVEPTPSFGFTCLIVLICIIVWLLFCFGPVFPACDKTPCPEVSDDYGVLDREYQAFKASVDVEKKQWGNDENSLQAQITLLKEQLTSARDRLEPVNVPSNIHTNLSMPAQAHGIQCDKPQKGEPKQGESKPEQVKLTDSTLLDYTKQCYSSLTQKLNEHMQEQANMQNTVRQGMHSQKLKDKVFQQSMQKAELGGRKIWYHNLMLFWKPVTQHEQSEAAVISAYKELKDLSIQKVFDVPVFNGTHFKYNLNVSHSQLHEQVQGVVWMHVQAVFPKHIMPVVWPSMPSDDEVAHDFTAKLSNLFQENAKLQAQIVRWTPDETEWEAKGECQYHLFCSYKELAVETFIWINIGEEQVNIYNAGTGLSTLAQFWKASPSSILAQSAILAQSVGGGAALAQSVGGAVAQRVPNVMVYVQAGKNMLLNAVRTRV